MREYREPTCAGFLKKPQVMGVSLLPLLLLLAAVSGFQVLGLPIVAASVAIAGYAGLRLHARFGRPGSEEWLIFWLERLAKTKPRDEAPRLNASFNSPDTLDPDQELTFKGELEEELRAIRPGCTSLIAVSLEPSGAGCLGAITGRTHAYSLFRVPSHTDPSWITAQLRGLKNAEILIRIDGIDQRKAKKMAERARRKNSSVGDAISSVDAEVSFEEASSVLEGICRGTEEVVRLSFLVQADEELALDPDYFFEEKNIDLASSSIRGTRQRPHRAHYLRLKTSTDLIPSFLDPRVEGFSFLETRRGFPASFSLTDERFDAHHALVVGSTGAGKSFFTGLSILRMLSQGEEASVLFMDHRRSFKRLSARLGIHLEPESLDALQSSFDISGLDQPGAVIGVELSELLPSEKGLAAEFLLEEMERFLAKRAFSHLVYLVIDECWNFLKEKPHQVQRAFREYRKLGGAMVAITHSLGDFLSTENGQVILQSAPIRILLRQDEDVSPYRSALNLNAAELKQLRFLKQKKGAYSECLIKTQYHSLLGRLHPTEDELNLLHTDRRRKSL